MVVGFCVCVCFVDSTSIRSTCFHLVWTQYIPIHSDANAIARKSCSAKPKKNEKQNDDDDDVDGGGDGGVVLFCDFSWLHIKHQVKGVCNFSHVLDSLSLSLSLFVCV